MEYKDRQRDLFLTHHHQVYKIAYLICNDVHLAQDIMQETFIKAFQGEGTLKDPKNVGSWLHTIAKRTAIDMMRLRKWNEIPTGLIELEIIDDNDPAKTVEEQIILEEVKNKLDRLKSTYKQVFVLKYVHQLRDYEIAEIINIELGTVKSRLHRAKKMLKTILDVDKDLGHENH